MSHEKQGPHHCRVVIIHVHPLRPWGFGGRGGSGSWVSVAWGLAVLVVSEVSVVASAGVLGLRTAAGVVRWHLLGQALSFCPDLCVGYNLVIATLAAVSYTPLHQGAAQARRQSVRLAALGQWSAGNIPWCMVAFGTAHGRRRAEPFTHNARR